MKTLLLLAALSTALPLNPAFAFGCWEPPGLASPGRVHVGEEEILIGDYTTANIDYVCEIGSIEENIYRAGCISDDGEINYISVTESGNAAVVTWNETAITYHRCTGDNPAPQPPLKIELNAGERDRLIDG